MKELYDTNSKSFKKNMKIPEDGKICHAQGYVKLT